MPEPAKETVIIVHGTFAAQDSVKRGWYEPVDGRPGGEPCILEMLEELKERIFMADRTEQAKREWHPPILRKLPITATANSMGTGKKFQGNEGNLSKNGDANYFS